MTSSASSVDSGVPVAAIARSAATTVGSTGSECTVISGMPHGGRRALLRAAKIERAADAELAQHRRRRLR